MGCPKKFVVFLCLKGLVGFMWGQNFLPSSILSLVFSSSSFSFLLFSFLGFSFSQVHFFLI
jgi:hypothetical protein